MANLTYQVDPFGLWKAAQDPEQGYWGRDPDEHQAVDQQDGPETSMGGDLQDTPVGEPVPEEPTGKDPRTLFWDPFAVVEQLGYRDKPTPVTYATLKAIVFQTPTIRAIIQTRLNQIASFCQPQRDRYGMGFRIKTRDSEHEPTKEDKKWIRQAESMMLRTGVTDNPRGRDDLETFVRKFALDSYMYDQACFEVVPDKRGRPCEWYAVDGSTLRLADTASIYLQQQLARDVKYVQIYDGLIVTEYTQNDLAFCVRNPSTDIRLYGYGTCESEMAMSAITSFLFAQQHNQAVFSQGSTAKVILNFKGTIPDHQLQAFRRYWYNHCSTVANAWRVPIVNSEELQAVNLQMNNRDMEFSAYMDWLLKTICALYVMDPSEVNFQYGVTGQRSAMSSPSNRDKIIESKERGLRPMLRFIGNAFNRHVIWPINESFEFEFIGLDSMTREQWGDLNVKRVTNFRTVDEVRAEDDYPPLPDGKGEVILNSVWMQYTQLMEQKKQQAQMQAQQQQMQAAGMGQPGMPGDPNQPGMQGGMPGMPGMDQSAMMGGPQGMPGVPDQAQLPPGEEPQEEGEPEDMEPFDEEKLASQLGKSRIIDIEL